MSLIQITNKEVWNQSVCALGGSFAQSFTYGEWQESVGHTVLRFFYENENSKAKCLAQFICFPLHKKLVYWYSPYGPVALNNFSKNDFRDFRDEVESFFRKNYTETVFVRMEHVLQEEDRKVFGSVRARLSLGSYMQPRLLWMLPLEKTEEELLMGMHQKARYSVRLAEKRGVVVEKIETNLLAYLDVFFGLIQKTAGRNGFAAHEKTYFETIFSSLEKEQSGFLLQASYQGEVIAMDLIFCFGDTATYLFGGSNDIHRDVCAPYMLKWQGIVEAKKRGMKFYNFGAISDLEKKENMQWEGITNFKVRFGGNKILYKPFYDVVLEPFWYYLYMIRKFFLSYKK